MEYSTQRTGSGARILRTDPGRATTEAVTTLSDPELAHTLVRVLAGEVDALGGEDLTPQPGLVEDALRAGPAPAALRRRALAAFDATLTAVPPALGEWHVVDVAVRLARLVADQPVAVRHAVRDELARLYEGLDEPLVVATVTAWRAPASRVVVNRFLAAVPDDVVAELAEPGSGDSGAPYALCDAYAEFLAATLDAVGSWDLVEVTLDRAALDAWATATGRSIGV